VTDVEAAKRAGIAGAMQVVTGHGIVMDRYTAISVKIHHP
jgi:hypothetical protein